MPVLQEPTAFAAVPKLNKAKVLELARCAYLNDHTNLVLLEP